MAKHFVQIERDVLELTEVEIEADSLEKARELSDADLDWRIGEDWTGDTRYFAKLDGGEYDFN
jgi:hypothetical protein